MWQLCYWRRILHEWNGDSTMSLSSLGLTLSEPYHLANADHIWGWSDSTFICMHAETVSIQFCGQSTNSIIHYLAACAFYWWTTHQHCHAHYSVSIFETVCCDSALIISYDMHWLMSAITLKYSDMCVWGGLPKERCTRSFEYVGKFLQVLMIRLTI